MLKKIQKKYILRIERNPMLGVLIYGHIRVGIFLVLFGDVEMALYI